MPRATHDGPRMQADDLALWDAFMRFHQKFFTELKKEAERMQLSVSQIMILRFVVGHKNTTMKDIAAYLRITAPSATSLITNLEEKKLVMRKIDPKDRRGVRVYTTKKTHELIARMDEIKATIFADLLAPLSTADKNQFAIILKKIL